RVPRTPRERLEPRRDGTGPDRVSIAFTPSDADIRAHHDLSTPGRKRHRLTCGKTRQADDRPGLPPAGRPHDHRLAGARCCGHGTRRPFVPCGRRSLIATLIVREPAAIALMVVLPAAIRRL